MWTRLSVDFVAPAGANDLVLQVKSSHMLARLGRLVGGARLPLRATAAGVMAASSLTASGTATTVACAASSMPSLPPGLPSNIDLSFLNDMSALQLQVLTVSGLTGYTAGFAIKRTIKVFVFTAGCIFMGLQVLSRNGLITVHYDEMEKLLLSAADLNKDGKIDASDLAKGGEKLEAYLSAGLPSAGSFSAGFLIGLRS